MNDRGLARIKATSPQHHDALVMQLNIGSLEMTQPGQTTTTSHEAIDAFKRIVGDEHVLTSERATMSCSRGYGFRGGPDLAVARAASVVEIGRALAGTGYNQRSGEQE